MLTMNDMSVGMKVLFGRPNGEKTFGEVIKINRKKVKVKTLEFRGSRSPKGAIWGVPPSLCVRANDDGTPRDREVSLDHRTESLVASAMAKLTDDELMALRVYFRD